MSTTPEEYQRALDAFAALDDSDDGAISIKAVVKMALAEGATIGYFNYAAVGEAAFWIDPPVSPALAEALQRLADRTADVEYQTNNPNFDHPRWYIGV